MKNDKLLLIPTKSLYVANRKSYWTPTACALNHASDAKESTLSSRWGGWGSRENFWKLLSSSPSPFKKMHDKTWRELRVGRIPRARRRKRWRKPQRKEKEGQKQGEKQKERLREEKALENNENRDPKRLAHLLIILEMSPNSTRQTEQVNLLKEILEAVRGLKSSLDDLNRKSNTYYSESGMKIRLE